MALLILAAFSLLRLPYFPHPLPPKSQEQQIWRIEALIAAFDLIAVPLAFWSSRIFHFPRPRPYPHKIPLARVGAYVDDLYTQFVSRTFHKLVATPVCSYRFQRSHRVHHRASDRRIYDSLRRPRVFLKGRLGCPNLRSPARFPRLKILWLADMSLGFPNCEGTDYQESWSTKDAKKDFLQWQIDKSIRNLESSQCALLPLIAYFSVAISCYVFSFFLRNLTRAHRFVVDHPNRPNPHLITRWLPPKMALFRTLKNL